MVSQRSFPELSDNTLVELATALKIENYRLLMPLSLTAADIEKTAMQDLTQDLQKIAQTKSEKTSRPNSTTPSKKEA